MDRKIKIWLRTPDRDPVEKPRLQIQLKSYKRDFCYEKDLSSIETQNVVDAIQNGLQKIISREEVEPVVHGEWVPLQKTVLFQNRFVCSVCEKDEYWKSRFCCGDERRCPNCGAKMDEGVM